MHAENREVLSVGFLSQRGVLKVVVCATTGWDPYNLPFSMEHSRIEKYRNI